MQSKTIALDIGGTRIKIAIVADGAIKRTTDIPAYSEGNLRDRLPAIESALRELTGGDFSDYQGMGVALPCLVDAARGMATEIHQKFEDLVTLDLPKWVRETFGLPCAVEQDSKAALLGEAHYGCAQGFDDVLLIIMGTGVGTAVMLGGRVLDSRNHCAGALGSHIVIEKDGRQCTCGNRGCLEAYTSGWALPQLIRDHPGFAGSRLARQPVLDFLHVKEAVLADDLVAREVLRNIARSLRTGIISLIHCFGPSAVVLCGGPMHMGELFTVPLLDGIREELWGISRNVDFMISPKPGQSVLLGLHYISLHPLIQP